MNINRKPKILEANYQATLNFDLEELGIDWDEVETYDIKWTTLRVVFKNGKYSEYHSSEDYMDNLDVKWPCFEKFYDGNYDEVTVDEN